MGKCSGPLFSRQLFHGSQVSAETASCAGLSVVIYGQTDGQLEIGGLDHIYHLACFLLCQKK